GPPPGPAPAQERGRASCWRRCSRADNSQGRVSATQGDKSMSEMTLLSYGASHEQQVEWYEPAPAARVWGFGMLVHRGGRRGPLNAGMMHPMVQDLLADGWAVANIECRRGGCGGQWRVVLEDVQLAMRQCRSRWEGRDGACIGIGHSVGGELVLLAEKEQD